MTPVDPVTNPLAALHGMAMDPMRKMMQQQAEGYDRSKAQLGKLQQQASRAPELDENERWSAMALAAAKTPPVVGGFGQLLANIGGAYGQTLSAQEQRNFEREAMIAKLMEQTTPFGQGAMTAMVTDALNPRLTNVAGVGLVDQRNRQVVVPANMMGDYTKFYGEFYKQAVEQKMPNPEQWAETQARNRLASVMSTPEIAGGRTTPFAPGASTGAQTQGAAVSMGAVGETDPGTGQKITRDTASWVAKLKQEEKDAVASGDYSRALEVKKARQALESQVTPTTATPAPAGLQYRDIPKSEMEKSQAGEVGKHLQEEAKTIRSAATASSDLIGQLKQLETIYADPSIPEGRLGDATQDIRSSLVSLGFLDKDAAKKVGAADLARAIAGKLALQTRIAGGQNLMPGAMTDFEQRILQSLAPGLNQTAEGRRALIQSLGRWAEANVRMAKELEAMTDERGIVSPDWYKRKQRLEKEERARIALEARDLKNRFGIK